MKFKIVCALILILKLSSCDPTHDQVNVCEYNGSESIDLKCESELGPMDFFGNSSTLKCGDRDVEKAIITKITYNNTCTLSTIPPGLFYSFKNVRSLFISSPSFDSMRPEDFLGADKLKELTVFDTELTVLPAALFANAPALKKITLEKNEIGEIDSQVFKGAENLEEIILSDGALSELDSNDLFEGLTKLKTLVMQRNDFKNLNFIPSIESNVIELIDLERNSMDHLEEHTFDNLGILISLSITESFIRHIEPNAFSKLENLTLLDLSGNGLESLSKKIFKGLNNLKIAKLSANPIKHIDVDTFDDLPNLVELRLNDCRLVSIDFVLFAHLMKLETLDLSGNSVDNVIFPTSMPVFSKLKAINLSGNMLFSISVDENKFPNLEKLGLSNNFFVCRDERNFRNRTHYCNGQKIYPYTKLIEI